MRRTWWSIAIGISFWMMASVASAEVYVAGFVGGNFPNKFSDVKLAESASSPFPFSESSSLSNLTMNSSLAYGAKVGWYLPLPRGWPRFFGLETEVYQATPNIPHQTVSGTNPVGLNTRVTTWAVNALVRYPGKRFQPYGGVGVGVFFAHASDFFANGTGLSDTNVGLNALAGIRYFLTEELAVFVEGKYNRVDLSFSGSGPSIIGQIPGHGNVSENINAQISGTYSTEMIVGGISLHF